MDVKAYARMSSLKEAKSYFKQCFNIIDLIPSNGVDFRERHEMKGRAYRSKVAGVRNYVSE